MSRDRHRHSFTFSTFSCCIFFLAPSPLKTQEEARPQLVQSNEDKACIGMHWTFLLRSQSHSRGPDPSPANHCTNPLTLCPQSAIHSSCPPVTLSGHKGKMERERAQEKRERERKAATVGGNEPWHVRHGLQDGCYCLHLYPFFSLPFPANCSSFSMNIAMAVMVMLRQASPGNIHRDI